MPGIGLCDLNQASFVFNADQIDDEDGMEFRLSRKMDFSIGLCTLFLAINFIFLKLFDGKPNDNLRDTIVSVFLLCVSTLFIFSCFRVKSILIDEQEIKLIPAGIILSKEKITIIRISYPEFFDQRGELNRLIIEMSDEDFSWIPLVFLRFKGKVSLKIAGVSESQAFMKALRALEN